MARGPSWSGRWRRWGPYVGLLLTAAMMTISSNIAQSEEENGGRGESSSVLREEGEEGGRRQRFFVRHVTGNYNSNLTIPSSTSTATSTMTIPGCTNPMPDRMWMNYVQRRRQREMWGSCNRCATTAAPGTRPPSSTSSMVAIGEGATAGATLSASSLSSSSSSSSSATSCQWRKRQLVPELLSSLLVDDKHRIIYCVIPKAACTNWKRALVRMSGRLNDTRDDSLRTLSVHDELFLQQVGLRYLNTYNLADIRRRMETYHKFLFVRHPLERLLSAYMEKFTIRNRWTEHFQRKYGRRIVRMFRKDAAGESLARGHDVTFGEFVKYVIKRAMAGKPLNPHWSTYNDLCHPCSIKYDFVGKFESFDVDSSYMLGQISGSHCPHPFPTIKPAGAATREVMHKYYSALPRRDIENLVKAYLPDFMMFGYDLNFSDYLSS